MKEKRARGVLFINIIRSSHFSFRLQRHFREAGIWPFRECSQTAWEKKALSFPLSFSLIVAEMRRASRYIYNS